MGERTYGPQPGTEDLPPGLLQSPAEEAAPAKSDPWANRSEGMRCISCMWFAAKTPALGRCRRRSPTMSGYPVVFPNDWCGDHKLAEESI